MNSRAGERGPREAILERLAAAARPTTLPPPRIWPQAFADLATRFEQALTAAKGEVRWVADLAGAWETVDGILDEVGAKAVVANSEPPIAGMDLPARWPERRCHIAGACGGDLRAACAAADVGLSGAAAALAETGTVVVASGPARSRLVTLLPPVHVALVPLSGLTADLFTWTAARNASLTADTAMPANVVLVSGPSKSADIEFTLTLGVHGPGRLIAILYDAD
ncbi:MAG: lactate utilization protein [Planctomycetota bacterium]|nr:lactate utilization protein [Planctomycetota bacterium]